MPLFSAWPYLTFFDYRLKHACILTLRKSSRFALTMATREQGIDVEDLEDFGTQINDDIDLNSLGQEIFVKLLVLGDLGAGKTSLIRKYVDGENCADYRVSVDACYHLKSLKLDGRRTVHIQLWDVPGHER